MTSQGDGDGGGSASGGEPTSEAPGRLTRRRFITLAAAGGGVAVLSRHRLLPAGPWAQPDAALVAAVEAGTVRMVHAVDQSLIDLRFVNLVLNGNQLEAIDGGSPSAIILDVGAQHTVEEGVDLAGGSPVPGAGTARRGRLADPSRVVVSVTPPLPFSAAGFLALGQLDLVRDPRADLAPGSGAPADDVTALALPTDVVLSPGVDGRFKILAPITHDGYTEQLQLRLAEHRGNAVEEASAAEPVPLRAISGGDQVDVFPRALDQVLRGELVEATSDATSVAYPDHEPLFARNLRLGLHGAFADLDGSWAGAGALASYRESIRSGQTTQVTVVERGYLAPFGQQASVVSVSGRRFETAGDGSVVSIQVDDEYLVIDGRPSTFPAPFMRNEGRGLPFTDVAVVVPSGSLGRAQVAWTDAGGVPRSIAIDRIHQLADETGVPIDLDHVATDRAGHRITFSGPAFYVPADRAFALSPSSPLGTLVRLYNDTSNYALARRNLQLGGQSLAFADEVEPGSESTTKATDLLRITLQRPLAGTTVPELTAVGQPAFYAAMDIATVSDPTLDSMRGADVATPPAQVSHDAAWLSDGNDSGANPARSFLRLVDRATLDFGGGGGGLVRPSLNVDLFGQEAGLTVDTAATGGDWDPLDALGDATILGLIELKDILGSIEVGVGTPNLPGLPVLTTTLEPLALPTELCVRFTWEPQVQSQSFLGHPVFVVTDDFGDEDLISPFTGSTAAHFEASACTALDEAGEASTDLTVRLERFALLLPPGLPALAVFLEHVTYSVPPDGAPALDFDVAGFQFVDSLAFLEPFRELLVGTKSGSIIDISDEGVEVHLPINVPDVSLGVARMSSLHVELGLFVPAGPEVAQPFTTTLAIGTRAAPVGITVYFFKGTASFEVELQPHPIGVKSFAASMGMGAEIAAGGFGVSGSIGMEISASIDYEQTGDGGGRITVGGKFTLHGELTVFVVLSAGLRATLSLRYFVDTKVLRAKGTVVGYVSLFGAVKEWRVEVTDDYSLDSDSLMRLGPAVAGGEASFGDVYSSPQWADYCKAFA